LLDELTATLHKKKLAKPAAATGLTAGQMLRNYRRLAALVTARKLAQPVSRDADDDEVLACARAARADHRLCGTRDLRARCIMKRPTTPPPAGGTRLGQGEIIVTEQAAAGGA